MCESDSVWVVPDEPRPVSFFISVLTDFLSPEARSLTKTGNGVQKGKRRIAHGRTSHLKKQGEEYGHKQVHEREREKLTELIVKIYTGEQKDPHEWVVHQTKHELL